MAFVEARKRLSAMMDDGRSPLGIFISSLDPAVTDIMGSAGFDFVVLDGEHGRFARADVESHVRAARAGGVIPFVRVLDDSPTLIQSMLDLGAQGILVPHVETAAQAAAAVAASRYAPRGRRGMCPACNAGGYGMADWPTHVGESDANVMIVPVLESKQAIDNASEILSVDGIDMALFGPGDLSADMGIDFVRDRQILVDCWQKLADVAERTGTRMMVPHGLGFDEGAAAFIVEMELMVLRKALGAIVDAHGFRQGADRTA